MLKLKKGDYIKDRIFEQKIPYCDKCSEETSTSEEEKKPAGEEEEEEDEEEESEKRLGILKPDIVFFGEGLPEIYHKSINDDKNKCDLLIVIGSSLKVKPVANIPLLLPKHIPQVLINRESLRHMNFDVELLGDCDVIVNELLMRLEQRRLARMTNEKAQETTTTTTEAAVVEATTSTAKPSEQHDEVEWADICKDKVLLSKVEGPEAHNLVFSDENK